MAKLGDDVKIISNDKIEQVVQDVLAQYADSIDEIKDMLESLFDNMHLETMRRLGLPPSDKRLTYTLTWDWDDEDKEDD